MERTIYKVKEKLQETKYVVTLKLICDGSIPEYKAGQFITVFFDDMEVREGKAYTISSEPNEKTLNITVKGIGKFSNRLCSLEEGDILEASLPYGYFYSESNTSSLIMIAGGIGVTPFRSMIAESIKKNPTRRLILFYSNKTSDEMVFKNEFETLQESSDVFKMNNYITQEEIVYLKKGRIKICDILEETKNINNREFLICGGIAFVRDFWKGLKESGVPEEIIYTEAFF